MPRTPIHPKTSEELSHALVSLRKMAESNDRLPLLFLVDPLRTFAEAGIKLSLGAQRYIQRYYPGHFHRDKSLYEQVRDGKRRLPWVTSARFRSR